MTIEGGYQPKKGKPLNTENPPCGGSGVKSVTLEERAMEQFAAHMAGKEERLDEVLEFLREFIMEGDEPDLIEEHFRPKGGA